MICPTCGRPYEGEATVSLDTNTALVNGHAISLTASEAEVLHTLLTTPGMVRMDRIISKVWGLGEPQNSARIVQVYISVLRKKLRGTGATIENTWGKGYTLILGKEPT